jgi:hypothetical protein
VWTAPELLGAPTSPRVVVEGVIEVKETFQAARNIQKWQKTGGFTHVLAYKSPKTPFFAQKYLQDMLMRCFLRNTSILKLLIT